MPSSGPARAARRSPSAGRGCPSSRRRTAGRSTAPSCSSIFARDHPGTADEATVEAFADAILALDDSVPTGTYVDMCSKLPLVDPAKLTVPTIVMRGQYDGIAGFDDLIEFFKRLPNPDKQFAVMAGHLARELPAEELPDGLPHPARVLHPARAGVPRMIQCAVLISRCAFLLACRPRRRHYPSQPDAHGGAALAGRLRRRAGAHARAAALGGSSAASIYVENKPGRGRHDRRETRSPRARRTATRCCSPRRRTSSARSSTRRCPTTR